MSWTRLELDELFKTLPLPVRYQVAEAAPPLPFGLWRFTDSNDVYADNINYKKVRVIELVIASDKPEDIIQQAVEDLLTGNGFTYSIRFTYLNSERIFETTYTMEVILTNG